MSDKPTTDAPKRTNKNSAADANAATHTEMTPTVLKALAEITLTLDDASKDLTQANYGLAKDKIANANSRLVKALQYFGYPTAKGSNR